LEEQSLGNVRTDQVKRTAKELVRRFPDKFTTSFEDNKHLVNLLLQGTTMKIRNQIAGYITHSLIEYEEVPAEEASTDDTEPDEDEKTS
jgi:small subunit ribosomal protein S17e